jgi:hypothetical protein
MLAVPAGAQNTRAPMAGVSAVPASIDRLAWLAGEWRGPGLGGEAIESYSAPTAGQIAGHFLLAKAGKPVFYELLQIAPAGGSLVYRVRHFAPDLTGWEDATGKAETFALVAIDDDAAYFDGLTLRRVDADRLDVWVRIESKGKTREELFRYRRVGTAR